MKTLYYNGNIITMAGQPMPPAVLCENGIIIATGEKENLEGEDVRLFDLEGKTMLPAFFDGHSHITTVARTMCIADLSNAVNIEELCRTLSEFAERKQPAEGEFIVGFGYDNNFFPGKAHPTKEDLDKVSDKNPIIIAHASGHMGVCNSLGLKRLGIEKDTPNPRGGVIGHNADGSLSGYLEETAFTANATLLKGPDYNEMAGYLKMAQDEYFKYGITTIQDGFTGRQEWRLLKKASEDGFLKGDVVCYVDIKDNADILKDNPQYANKYKDNLKIGGYKLFLDGSPQGRTAWMTRPYENSGDYCGYPIYSDSRVSRFVHKTIRDRQQLLCHCNGDAAARQFIQAFEKADEELDTRENYMPVLVHGQLATARQMKQAADLGMAVTFFTGHIWQWADVHIENFGERGMKICPVNSAVKNDVVYTFHRDSPVLPPDVMLQVSCAVNRITKNGTQLDESEKVTVYDALKAVTINGARQYGEEKTKGSIEVGKQANFAILDTNPLLCPKEKLADIKVEYTILRDEVVYER